MAFGGIGKEAITFVLSGDASGLIKSFGDVEKAAAKDLGKTEDHITKLSKTATKVGAAAMGAGLSTALGLVQTVKDFEKAENAANKFETAVTGMGSKIDTGRIKRLATDLQQVARVTNDQVIEAARWGAVYGLTTDQLEELLRAAVDLSAQTGKSLDVTTKILAKAASGEGYKALGKLGLTFDETAYKADAFGTTISEATEFAGGAAAKQVDTMSGQLERLGNNWDDIKEQIGAGANEVFEPMARSAADLTEWLSQANPELLKTVGHFTALGSIGMTAFGGLSTLAGQFVNIKDAADGLGVKLKDADGGLTNLGRTMAGLGIAGGVIAGGIALQQGAIALDNLGKSASQADTAIKQAKIADSMSDLGRAMNEANEAAKGGFESFMEGMPGAAKATTISVGGVTVEIDKLRDVVDKWTEDDPALALRAVDAALADLEPRLKSMSDEDKARNPMIERHVLWLNKKRDELSKNVEATKELEKGEGDLAKADLDEAEATKVATEMHKQYTEAIGKQSGALGLYAIGAGQAAAGAKGFADALEAVDVDERALSALALGDAFHNVADTVKDLPHHFDENAASLGLYNDEQQKAFETVTAWGDAAKTQIDTLLKTGATNDEVRIKTAAYRDQLAKVMEQAGLTKDEIAEYQRIMGLTDEEVETAIKLKDDEIARFKLQFMQGQLDQLDEGAQAEILAYVHDGEWQKAEARMAELAAARYAPVWAQFMGWHGGNPYGIGYSGGGGWGGTRSAPATSTAVVPMATAAPAPKAIAPAPITINVTAGIGDPAEIGRKVIDMIRAAERVQGRGWRAA